MQWRFDVVAIPTAASSTLSSSGPKRPVLGEQCKMGEESLSRNISYFSARANTPLFDQVHMGTKDGEVPASKARMVETTDHASRSGMAIINLTVAPSVPASLPRGASVVAASHC